MPSDFVRNCRLLELVLLTDTELEKKRSAREALLDCLLVMVEASEAIGLKNSTLMLDIVADVIFAEVDCRKIPIRTLGAIIRVAEAANSAIAESHPPKFVSTRSILSCASEMSPRSG